MTSTATPPSGKSILVSLEQPPESMTARIASESLKDPEVNDFGWNGEPHPTPIPLIHGLSNDDLYALIRRFNKQVVHVKAIAPPASGFLDLEIAEDEEFSPDKLRANLERLYMTVIVGMAGFGKHIARLRSWNEPRRSAAFSVTYFVAWFYHLLGPLVFSMLILIIVDPPIRTILFPPAPLSATTDNVQVPKCGIVGSKDSLSGAPETYKGEAVEQEAHHFVSGFASIAVGAATGQQQTTPADGERHVEDAADRALPDPTAVVSGASDAKNDAAGGPHEDTKEIAKKSMEAGMWEKARPVMRILADIADTWERCANALSPTAPFPKDVARLNMAAVIFSGVLLTLFVDAASFVKGITLGVGVILFGQPLLTRGAYWLNHKYPNWRYFLDLKNTVLLGVPTNAQLTLTLLRLGESHKSPIPPPPPSSSEPSPAQLPEDDTSNDDVDASPDYTGSDTADSEENVHDGDNAGSKSKQKPGSKIAGLLKRTAKAGVGGALGIDRLKAKVGSEPAKRRLGVLPEANDPPAYEGPSAFGARLDGKKGRVVLVESAASPCVTFVADTHHGIFVRSEDNGTGKDLESVVTMALAEIAELRKVGGLGWKGKLVVGWAMETEVVDGLEIVDRTGNKILWTGVKGRDELFNRLIAVGGHRWESR